MDSRFEEVISVLSVLNEKLAQYKERCVGGGAGAGASWVPAPLKFTAQGVGNSFSGLQSMSNTDSSVVTDTLGLLADVAEASGEIMRPRDVGNALFGMQGMDVNVPEVRAALDVLLQKMRQGGNSDAGVGLGVSVGVDAGSAYAGAEDEYSVKDIGYCLSGISGMPRLVYSEVDELLSELNLKVAKSKLAGNSELTFLQSGKRIKVRIGGR